MFRKLGNVMKDLYRSKPLFVYSFGLTTLLAISYFIFQLEPILWSAILFYLWCLVILFVDDFWKEPFRAVVVAFTVPPFIILTFTSLAITYLILGDFGTDRKAMYWFVSVYCLQTMVYFIVLHLSVIRRGYKKRWNAAAEKEQTLKEIEKYLNKIKTASGYVAPIFSIPGLIYKAIELYAVKQPAVETATNTVQTASTSTSGTDLIQIFLFIYVFSLLVMTWYRARIDHFIYEIKFDDKFKAK